jgi:hypothetical protein
MEERGLTFTTAPASGVAILVMFLGRSLDIGTPGDGTVSLAKMAVNSIDSDQYVDASIDNAHLADDAVGVAELSATGTASSSTFLRGDNAWAAAGGGAWNLIGTAVASNSANLTITGLNSTYDTYAISWSDIEPVTDGQNLSLQVGDASGLDTGSDYSWHRQALQASSASYGAGVSASDTDAQISNAVGDQAGEGCGGMIFLTRPGDGTMWPTWAGSFSAIHGATALQGGTTIGARNAVITLDRVAILFGSGNIQSGRLTVWGIAHA